MREDQAGVTGDEKSDSNHGADQSDDVMFLDILLVLAADIKLLVVGPLIFGIAALIFSFIVSPTFTATTRFLPPQQQQSAAASLLQSLGGLASIAATSMSSPTDQYVAFLKTESVENALIDRFELLKRYNEKYYVNARKILEGNTKIGSSKDGIIVVSVDDKDPKVAAQIANAYIEEFGSLLSRLAVTEAQRRRVFFEKQLVLAKGNLITAEQALAASGVSVSALNANPAAAIEGPARLRAQVTAQEVKLASMRTYLTDSAPEYRQALSELSALQDQLREAEKEQPKSHGTDDYIAKYREFKYQETLFELFSKQYEMAKLDESREGGVAQIVDPAVTPEKKSKPKRGLIAIVTVFLIEIVLLSFVLIRDSIRRSCKDQQTAEKLKKLTDSLPGFVRRRLT